MTGTWILLLAVVSLVALVAGMLGLAWSHRRLGLASTVAFLVIVALWFVDVALVASGVGDTDGFVDCGDSCTTTQRAAALGLLAPPLLISVAAAGMLVALVTRGRRRRSSG
jgi:hypothetical protein